MKRIQGRLTYANVVSTLALFLVLAGGSAFAASKLGANSVKTRQIKNGAVTAAKIKNGAVTPIKLSSASKAALSGPPGAAGPTGPRGEQGPQGPKGERGPGALSLEVAASSSVTTVGTFGGIEVKAACSTGSFSEIILQTGNGTGRFEVFGTSSANEESKVYAVNLHTFGLTFIGGGSEHAVTVDVDARPSGVAGPWTRFDLHVDAVACLLSGTVIESQAP
ncbi:MAG: collagen-like protein [Actinobacteria bacterium]|nr:collagen-like protein [Actinomycetota bacterium]